MSGGYQQAYFDSPENRAIVSLIGIYFDVHGQIFQQTSKGTGVLVSPDMVLSVAHNFVLADDVTDPQGNILIEAGTSPVVSTLFWGVDTQGGLEPPRGSFESSSSIGEVWFLRGDVSPWSNSSDLALARTEAPIAIEPEDLPGLIAFAPGALSAEALRSVRIAGYPVAPSEHPDANGGDLLQTVGTWLFPLDTGRMASNTESSGGLSGSPVFTTQEGVEVVAGVHQGEFGLGFLSLELLGKDVALSTADLVAILGHAEASSGGADSARYRNNFFIGVDSANSFFSDDAITGSYRRDVVQGLGGDDRLEGQGSHDLLEGGAGDDILVGDGDRVGQSTDAVGRANYDQFGDDFLDGGTGGGILFGENDTVLAGADHTLATTIEIGNAGAHQGTFDAAGYPGVTLTGDARDRRAT